MRSWALPKALHAAALQEEGKARVRKSTETSAVGLQGSNLKGSKVTNCSVLELGFTKNWASAKFDVSPV